MAFTAHCAEMDSGTNGRTFSGATLMLGAGVLYAGSRMAVFALSRPDGSDAGRRAVGQWLPIAATVIAAILYNTNTPENPASADGANIAVAVIFGTSVACLSLVLGLVTYLAPMQTLPVSKRAWPFVLPAALLPLIAGFSGRLTWWHALMLLALGGAILPVWIQSPEELDPASLPGPKPSQAALVMLGSSVFMILGAYLAVKGTIQSAASTTSRIISPGTLAATILSPLLVLPTLGTSSAIAQRGFPGRAVSALVGTVFLNLCLLLPIAILLWYLKTGDWHLSVFKEFSAPWESTHALPFMMASWRIQTVLLVVLGFALVPMSMGRWFIGRIEATALVLGYGAYVWIMTIIQ